MSQIPDDEGMLPGGITPDETTQGTVVEGPSDQPTLSAPVSLEKWSDEDPEYVEFEDAEEDDETAEPDDLTEEELAVEPLESDPMEGPQWVRYELWAQNLDEASDWELVAVEDVDGDTLEAEIGQIPTATRMRFRLRLIDANGQHSKWSEAVDITTPRDLVAPPAPVVPSVVNHLGFITVTASGGLTDEVPPDMSHRNLYIQQVSGSEPGDPQLMTRFYGVGSGTWTTGNLPDLEHRAFLTSVDTSGNESARSEYVYFTPEPPVGRDTIQEEVDKVEERVGENLTQQLTVGLADILDSMADREESVIDRAKREAAEDAQSTYDVLAAAAAEAQQKANDVAAEQGETSQAAQQALQDAQAAASAAAAAAQAASAAHEQAGQAAATAQQALASANGKNQIRSSTSAPSGTGNEGDLWYRWSSTGMDRRLTGIWTWESGSWRAMGTLDTTMVPRINIGEGTIGQLVFDRIAGFAAQVQHLAIGAYQNIWHDLELREWAADGLNSDLWTAYTRSGIGFSSISNQSGIDQLVRWNPPGGSGIIRVGQSTEYATPVRPGEEYRLRCFGWRAEGGDRVGIRPAWRTRTGSHVSYGSLLDFTAGSNSYESVWTVPDNSDIRLLTWELYSSGGGDGGGGSGAGRGHWGDFEIVKMVDGSLIVQGSIGAREINVADLAADTARMGVLWGGFANFLEGRFDQLFSNDFQSRSIEGATIRGGHYETTPAAGVTTVITAGLKRWLETEVLPDRVIENIRTGQASHMSFMVTSPTDSPGILRASNHLILSGGRYANPIGHEGSHWGQVIVSGSRLLAPATSAGHLDAESLQVTSGGLVGTARALQLTLWTAERSSGEIPHAVQMGRQVIVGGAIAMQNPGDPATGDRLPWGHPNRTISGFPPPDVAKRFSVPVISGQGNMQTHLTFEIDINGVGRFIGTPASTYRNAFLAHLDGISYMTSIAAAGQGESRNRLGDPNFIRLSDPLLYYSPGPWANSAGSELTAAGGGHGFERFLNFDQNQPQLGIRNTTSLRRIGIRQGMGQGIAVAQGQTVNTSFRYWNPDDSLMAFRPWFYDAADGSPLRGRSGESQFDLRLRRGAGQPAGQEFIWSLEDIDLGGSGSYYFVPTFHFQGSSSSNNYNVRSLQVTLSG